MSQPTMTCDKCGFQKVVTKDPRLTRTWFAKYHKDCGQPIYRAGIDPYLVKMFTGVLR